MTFFLFKFIFMDFTTIALSKGKLFIPQYAIDLVEKMTFDEIYSGFDQDSKNSAAVELQAELMRYGLILDEKAFKAVTMLSAEEFDRMSASILDYLRDTYGDNGNYRTLFGNFPHTVMQMPDYVMLLHTIVHYLSDGKYIPKSDSAEDSELNTSDESFSKELFKESYVKIPYISVQGLCDICRTICSSEQSLSSYDKAVVEYFCQNYPEIVSAYSECFPEKIPFKETLCMVASFMPEYRLETVTDVLRLAAYMSGIDISFPAIPKTVNYGWQVRKPDMSQYNFKKFTRAERRMLLAEVEQVFSSAKNPDSVLAEMKGRLNKWIRLGEILHPGEYRKQFPQTADAFDKLRNAAKYIKTFNAEVEMYREKGDLDSLIALMSTRPGEFARNIDWILRKNSDQADKVISAFEAVLPKVSMKVLYELAEHFHSRNENIEDRMVYLKGARKPVKIKDSEYLDEHIVDKVVERIIAEISDRFKGFPSLEGYTVVVDESLADIMLPANMRSMNDAVKQLPRGSAVRYTVDSDILRLYCRWNDEYGKSDLDLTCTLMDSKYSDAKTLSWNSSYSIKDGKEKIACFSGDVRHRKGLCAEYIDINIQKILAAGYRYVVMTVYDYEGKGFDKNEAYIGALCVDSMSEGDTAWYPKDVKLGFSLKSQCTNVIAAVVDLQENKIYVADEDSNGIPVALSGSSFTEGVAKRYIEYGKNRLFNCFNLICMNANARGCSSNGPEPTLIGLPHEQILKVKEENICNLQKIKDIIAEISAIPESDKTPEMIAGLDPLVGAKDKLEHMVFVTYDDITASYTNIFEWMFGNK